LFQAHIFLSVGFAITANGHRLAALPAFVFRCLNLLIKLKRIGLLKKYSSTAIA
jgi:hypothetical protein